MSFTGAAARIIRHVPRAAGAGSIRSRPGSIRFPQALRAARPGSRTIRHAPQTRHRGPESGYRADRDLGPIDCMVRPCTTAAGHPPPCPCATPDGEPPRQWTAPPIGRFASHRAAEPPGTVAMLPRDDPATERPRRLRPPRTHPSRASPQRARAQEGATPGAGALRPAWGSGATPLRYASPPSSSSSGSPARICSAIRPAFCRMAASILAATSGLARRKVLAFSRPCPMRVES